MRDGGLTSQEFVKEQEGREYRETGEEGKDTHPAVPQLLHPVKFPNEH